MRTPIAFDDMEFQLKTQRDVGPFLTNRDEVRISDESKLRLGWHLLGSRLTRVTWGSVSLLAGLSRPRMPLPANSSTKRDMAQPLNIRNGWRTTINTSAAISLRRNLGQSGPAPALGAQLQFVGPGEVHITLAHAASITQQNNFIHAGAIASIADSACGYAALTLAAPDTDVLSVEFKINLLAPARAPAFIARGRVVRSGRTLSMCQADVHGISDQGEELVATMLSTIIFRPVVLTE